MMHVGFQSHAPVFAGKSVNPLVRLQERSLSLMFPDAPPEAIQTVAAEGRNLMKKHFGFILRGAALGAVSGGALSRVFSRSPQGSSRWLMGAALGGFLGFITGNLLHLPKMLPQIRNFQRRYYSLLLAPPASETK